MPRPRRRPNPHPRYGTRGRQPPRRLSAEEVRRAHQAANGGAAALPSGAEAAGPSRQRLSAGELRRLRVAAATAPPPAIPPGGPRPGAAPRRHRRRRAALGVVGLVVLALVVAGGYGVWRARAAYSQIFVPVPPRPVVVVNAQGTPVIVTNPTQIARVPTPTPFPGWTGTNRINLLLLGSDDLKAGEPGLSDTIIIVTIDPVTKQVGMMSLPRDMLVTIPGAGQQKINAAYTIGKQSSITGPGLSIATIEYDFHIHINYFAVVDFNGFQKIVNTLGGVTLDVPAPLKDDQYPSNGYNYTRIYFHTGLQHLNGLQALEYVRTRHDDNDFARGRRQQQLLEALRKQATAMDVLTHASTLLNELSSSFQTDIPPGDLLRLAKLGTEIKTSDIKSYSLLPALTQQWNPNNPNSIYYLIPNWTKVARIVNQMIPPTPTTPATPAAGTPAASGTPDLQGKIKVENGTYINQLAAHAAARLEARGFTSVSAVEASNPGQHPTTQVVSFVSNPATAQVVARTLGLPASDIINGDPAQSNGYAVVVILGSNAPNPGG
ncbi:MAG TPA: LCP family protein [Thermomicrobiaceae bacterium]|nr:LCP family protein [Thermomicrobiaceae bacterium]